MLRSRALAGAVLVGWVCATGCTTLKEVPRQDFAARPERKGVRVETREGLVYEFDYATFDADSLTGYRHRPDVEGPVDETAMFRVALDDVDHLTTRAVDWYRTGLVGGGVIASVLAVGLQAATKAGGDGNGGGTTTPPRIGVSASRGGARN